MNRGLYFFPRQPPHGRRLLPKFCFTPWPRNNGNVSNRLLTNWQWVRRYSSTVDSKKSGFIDLAPGEGLLFFDNVYPLKTAIYDIRYLMMRYDKQSIESRIRAQYIPEGLLTSEFTITEIVPRLKDGGAFVKFRSPNVKETEAIIADFLREKKLKPWFSPFKRVRAYIVRGKPWLEDLYRFPSTRLKVEFIGGEGSLSQEAIYALFRRYGRIIDILPQPPGSKELPKFTIVQYLRTRGATAARNCLHGYTVPETEVVLGKEPGVTLRILYERTIKTHWIKDWLVNHPRIVIPLVAAFMATFTVAIFDPVRTWFVKAKITGALNISDNTYYNWLKRYTIGMLPIGAKHTGMDDLWAVWDERKEQVEQLKAWLSETVETFIVVQGPRGSGKKDLVVDTVLAHRKNVLIIDCEPIDETHGDSAAIAAAAAQVGYRPVFSWLNTISSLLDLAAQGTIGSSAGFSQTLETQFNKILQNTGTALKVVALRDKGTDNKDQGLSDDEYLSAHPEKRPVVVIDNFLHMEGNSIIYKRLADWAAILVSANIAHVIFLTNDTSFSKSLAKSLPDRVFRSILLGDAQPDSAKRFVLKHIDNQLDGAANEKARAELDDSIQALGGRLTDLEFLSRRIKTGETPKQAVGAIIETSAQEILKLYLLEEAGRGRKRTWATEQAWHLVKTLAEKDEVAYHHVLVHDLFKFAGEDALQNLEQAELVTIVTRDGRPWCVKPGRPVFQAAFRRLVADRVLCARMDFLSLALLTKVETAAIQKAGEELEKIAVLPNRPKERVGFLLAKIAEAQGKIDKYEEGMRKLKGVLKEEY
ncbi:RNA12 protein-domain-containing protein [Tuber brumale]|nr:RNA12 protein-domain-containing protein [Tuber brumale]